VLCCTPRPPHKVQPVDDNLSQQEIVGPIRKIRHSAARLQRPTVAPGVLQRLRRQVSVPFETISYIASVHILTADSFLPSWSVAVTRS
jgi:hypothetical protein